MKIQGRVFKVCDVQKGTRKDGSEWRRQDVVIEYFENASDMWTQKIVVQLNNSFIDEYHLREGDNVSVRFGLYTNEWNGRYFQEVRLAQDGLQVLSRAGQRAAQIAQPTEQVQQPPATQTVATQQVAVTEEQKKDENDGLPF